MRIPTAEHYTHCTARIIGKNTSAGEKGESGADEKVGQIPAIRTTLGIGAEGVRRVFNIFDQRLEMQRRVTSGERRGNES
jgi:hypothetical protein